MNKKEYQEKVDERIRYTVDFAYHNVPFYHDMFEKEGMNPSSIKNAKDLQKVPLTKPSDILAQPAGDPSKNKFVNQSLDKNMLFPLYTSGTAGKPKEIWYSKKIAEMAKEGLLVKSFLASGFNPEDVLLGRRVVTFWRSGEGHASHSAVDLAYPLALSFSPSKDLTKEEVEEIIDRKAIILVSIPSRLLKLIKEFRDFGVDPRVLELRGILTAGESTSPYARKYIEESFNTKIFDLYVATEMVAVAYECNAHRGLHLHDMVHLAVMNDRNEYVGEGERGRLILTTICLPSPAYFGTILLNYDIGDETAILGECECGIETPLIDYVHSAGRETFGIANVNVDTIREYLLKDFPNEVTGVCQVILTTDEESLMDIAELRVETKERNTGLKERIKNRLLEDELIKYTAECLADFKISLVDNIPPGEGIPNIIDRRLK